MPDDQDSSGVMDRIRQLLQSSPYFMHRQQQQLELQRQQQQVQQGLFEQAQRQKALQDMGGDPSKAWVPTVTNERYQIGEGDSSNWSRRDQPTESVPDPQYADIPTESYSPQQRAAQAILFNRMAPDRDPQAASKEAETIRSRRDTIEERKEGRKTSQAIQQERIDNTKAAQDQTNEIRRQGIGLRKQAAQQHALEVKEKEGYSNEDVSSAYESAYDSKTGELDYLKFDKTLAKKYPQGSPRRQADIENHKKMVNFAAARFNIAKQKADLTLKQNPAVYRMFQMEARHYEEQLKAFEANPNNIGKQPPQPPNIDQYMQMMQMQNNSTTLQPGGAAPQPNKPKTAAEILGMPQ